MTEAREATTGAGRSTVGRASAAAPSGTALPVADLSGAAPSDASASARFMSALVEAIKGWWSAIVTSARRAAPAIAGYATVRAIGLVALFVWAHHLHRPFWRLLSRYDAVWYVQLAQHGYDHAIPVGANGALTSTNLAFFPVYPAVIRAVATVLPISYPAAGLIIAWIASLVAAWGLFAVGNHLLGRRAGILLAIIWGVLPYSLVQQMGLTEALFTAMAAWTLYALLQRRWFTAAGICVIAGLTRPTALALVAAIGLAAGISLWRRDDRWWRPVLATAIAPLGWLAFIIWVAIRLGRADGWYYVEAKAWNSSFDAGAYTRGMLINTFLGRPSTLIPYMVTLFLIVCAVLLVLSVLERQAAPLLVYSTLLIVMPTGGTGFFHTDPRHIIPAFTILLPLVAAAARMRQRNLLAVLVVLTCISSWYGGYLSFIGHSSF